MSRFRITLLALTLMLAFLGYNDISEVLRNDAPAEINLNDLDPAQLPQEWLRISGGFLDMENAISTTGTVELEALLVPLKRTKEEAVDVLVETRDPELLKIFQTIHFNLDSALQKERFIEEHQAEIWRPASITGMVMTGYVAKGNRKKLLELASSTDMAMTSDIFLFTQGSEPSPWRGLFFLAMAIGGVLKFISLTRQKNRKS